MNVTVRFDEVRTVFGFHDAVVRLFADTVRANAGGLLGRLYAHDAGKVLLLRLVCNDQFVKRADLHAAAEMLRAIIGLAFRSSSHIVCRHIRLSIARIKPRAREGLHVQAQLDLR